MDTTRVSPERGAEPPELWWSPTYGLLTYEDGLYWVISRSKESLRHRLGTGQDSNPPLPDDVIEIAPAVPASASNLCGRSSLARRTADGQHRTP